jgi:uncharacterized UPF0160 family protein
LNLGFGLGLSRKVYRDEVGVNYNFAEFKYDQAKDPSFEAFNTPKHKVKASSKRKLFKNFGFNVWKIYAYLWQSTMVDGIIDATVIDAQINYELPN